MRYNPLMTHLLRAYGALATAAMTTVACGSSAPSHYGYAAGTTAPWEEASDLELGDRGEAEVVGQVNYPDRERAKWYAVDLPAPGTLRAQLRPVTFGTEEPAELGLEVYDSHFERLGEGEGRQPGGPLTQEHTEVGEGTHYVHIYATERLGSADFTLRVAHQPDRAGGDPTADVPLVAALPEVPDEDDAPPERPPRRPRPDRPAQPDPEPDSEPIAARIADVAVTGDGTQIRINRGQNHGVEEGWQGRVTTSGGGPIPDGEFVVDRVTDNEAIATVRASLDAVTSAGRVRLEAP